MSFGVKLAQNLHELQYEIKRDHQAGMKKLVIFMLFCAHSCAFAQALSPTLEQIKIAADAGDPVAQDQLAEKFILRIDTAQAEEWYRKSAAQGYVHAQGQLGNMLFNRNRMGFGLKPEAREAIGDEAFKWATLAANQGDQQGQANLADMYLEGKLVKQDFTEAYKWGDLAAEGVSFNVPTITGRSARDNALLKMDAGQIAEGRGRVAAFSPHTTQPSDLPLPAWTKKIKLAGISGPPSHRLAVLGDHTFETGEKRNLKIDGKNVVIQCLGITDKTVIISIEGVSGNLILNLN